MYDAKWIRENAAEFDRGLQRRGLPAMSPAFLELDKTRRDLVTVAQNIQTERNNLSKQIGIAKAKGEDAGPIMARVGELKDKQAQAEAAAAEADAKLTQFLETIPNLPADDVPEGADASANREVRAHGGKPNLGFAPKQHFELGEALGLMDFARAAKLSGARFTVLSGGLARLERALGQFMLDLHTRDFGYMEVNPPLLVRTNAVYGTGQLPKFADDLFRTETIDRDLIQRAIDATPRANQGILDKIAQLESIDDPFEKQRANEAFLVQLGALLHANKDDLKKSIIEEITKAASYPLWLIPTAEVPLTNLVADEIISESRLPLRMTALTPCFRSEAGAAGKDTRGMIRQHQFSKVELVSIAHPDKSEAEHQRMTECAEEVLKRLGLHYRVMLLSTGDMGFSARKTYDIEVWLPGQDAYREISSCSNCGEFQARRMNARFKKDGDKGTRPVHTLNGSGLAVGRALIAVMESYQLADGSIAVPEALHPYMGGLKKIEKATGIHG